ncbi:hypothetical protein B0T21DRAFT_407780 [Apiosordaria backusii]|uniref:Uncharacterized protein n=1 Tax=Apiosordaria backusii TaxID=314023 RepID=A0AA40ESI0_9PEZI|nr:hypothetical protein B0T21DRAFT_407780 [Apiosordaria backusii]
MPSQTRFNGFCDAMVEYHIDQKARKMAEVEDLNKKFADYKRRMDWRHKYRLKSLLFEEMVRKAEREAKCHKQEVKKWLGLRG